MLDLSQLRSAVHYEGGLSRRLFLAYGASLAAIPKLNLQADDRPKSTVKFASDPFSLGVASGDPSDNGVVLWTRLAPKPLQPDGGMPRDNVDVRWVVADDEGLKQVRRSGKAVAQARLGHSLHVEVDGLKPDRWYWYQFQCGDASSPAGHTRTMPDSATIPAQLKFAFASCQHYEDGLFTAYKHMAKDDLDLVVHLGDYIYEGAAHENLVRRHIGGKLRSLAEYRLRHSQYRSDPLLQKMHALCPWIVTWDDHEFENNYANNISKYKGVDPVKFLEQRAHAYHAYYEMMPLRSTSVPRGPNLKLFRTASFGQLISFQVLDTRQYRTNQPNNDEGSDLNRNALNPNNTLLGPVQRKWLEESLRNSKAIWNVLAQQVMMGMVDRLAGNERKYSMDAWPGYAYERMKLVQFLAEHQVSNPVVLTGDIHSSWVNDLRVDDRRPELPIVATEFVGTSITSGGNGNDVNKKKLESLYKENPCLKFHDERRGYVRCVVTPDSWQSDYRTLANVTKTGAEIATKASFVVRAGMAGAIK